MFWVRENTKSEYVKQFVDAFIYSKSRKRLEILCYGKKIYFNVKKMSGFSNLALR